MDKRGGTQWSFCNNFKALGRKEYKGKRETDI